MNTERILMKEEPKKPRYFFLDNIKVLFTILVIYQHVMVTYVGQGGWYYIESNITSADPISAIIFMILISFGGLFQASLMGLFFLLGGYFTPKSFDRKGGQKFWKERLIRLGVPLLLYIFVISPIIVMSLNYFNLGIQTYEPLFQQGPMWFLTVLLMFTAGYTLWRLISKKDWVKRKIPKEFSIPRYFYLLLLAIGLGCLTFLVRIVYDIDNRPLGLPWGQMIQYIMMFTVGIICIRYHWFEKMTKKHVKTWVLTIITAYILLSMYYFLILGTETDFAVLMGGASLPAFLFALTENIICMGMIFVVIKVFYAKFNKQGPILRNLSNSAFPMYLIHPPILVGIAVGFISIGLIPILKLAAVFPLGILLCYLLSHYVFLKIPWKRKKKSPSE